MLYKSAVQKRTYLHKVLLSTAKPVNNIKLCLDIYVYIVRHGVARGMKQGTDFPG